MAAGRSGAAARRRCGEQADDGVYVARPEAPARQRGSGPAIPERPSAPPPSGAGRAFTAADFPGWDAVTIDFPFEDEPEDADGTAEGAKQLIPGQRTGAAEPAAAEDGADPDPGAAVPPERPSWPDAARRRCCCWPPRCWSAGR